MTDEDIAFMQGLEGKVGELGIRLAEHLHPGYTFYALENGAGNCPEAGTVVGDLIRLPLVGKVNVWLYKLPPECLKLSDLNVRFSLEGIDFDLGDIEIDFWEGLKDMGKGFAESLYFEKDPEDEKKVILRSEGQKVAAITLESKEKAEELVNISVPNGEITTLRHNSDREYGWLSAAQESGGDPCVIGYDSGGGCSYGRHQLAVRTGKFEAYKKYVESNYASHYGKYGAIFTEGDIALARSAGSKEACLKTPLTEAFKKVCNDDNFSNLAHNVITEQNYRPVYDKIMDQFAGTVLFSNMSPRDEEALKEMCYSLGVQHGGAFKVFQLALLKDYTVCEDSQVLDTNNKDCPPDEDDFSRHPIKDQGQVNLMKSTANQIDIETFINRVYAARKMYVKENNAPYWQNMVIKRYKKEPETLKRVLNITN